MIKDIKATSTGARSVSTNAVSVTRNRRFLTNDSDRMPRGARWCIIVHARRWSTSETKLFAFIRADTHVRLRVSCSTCSLVSPDLASCVSNSVKELFYSVRSFHSCDVFPLSINASPFTSHTSLVSSTQLCFSVLPYLFFPLFFFFSSPFRIVRARFIARKKGDESKISALMVTFTFATVARHPNELG